MMHSASLRTIPSELPSEQAGPPRPWRVIGRAVLIVVAAVVAGFVYAIVAAVAGAIVGFRPSPHVIYRLTLIMMVIIESGILWLVLRHVWRTDRGRMRAALAAGPIRRPWLLAVLLVAELAYATYAINAVISSPACVLGLRSGMDRTMVVAAREGPFWLAIFLLTIVVIAPLAEEMLFRGWLWTSLRRSWGSWPTALVTGGMFWCLHLPDGLHRALSLLPLVVALTLVRQFCGSVRGTIVLHAVYNSGVAALTLVLLRVC